MLKKTDNKEMKLDAKNNLKQKISLKIFQL